MYGVREVYGVSEVYGVGARLQFVQIYNQLDPSHGNVMVKFSTPRKFKLNANWLTFSPNFSQRQRPKKPVLRGLICQFS